MTRDHARRRLVESATCLTLVCVLASTVAAPQTLEAQTDRNPTWLKVALASGVVAGGFLALAHVKHSDAEDAYLNYRSAMGAMAVPNAVLFRAEAERAESWQKGFEWAAIGAGAVSLLSLGLYAVSGEGPGPPPDPSAQVLAFRGPDFIQVTSTAKASLQIMLQLRF